MFYTVYKTTNKINGKFYIGCHKTEDLDDEYMGSGTILKRAFKKYGIKNFEKQILHVFDSAEEMFQKEKELVYIGEETYNIKEGGSGGWDYINKFNLRPTKNQQIENGKKGYAIVMAKYSKEYMDQRRKENAKAASKKNFGNKYWLGKKHKKDTKQKMREKAALRIGEKNSSYGSCWIFNEIENKKIKKDSLDEWLKLGYKKGRLMSLK